MMSVDRGKTGSELHGVKATQLTRRRHQPVFEIRVQSDFSPFHSSCSNEYNFVS